MLLGLQDSSVLRRFIAFDGLYILAPEVNTSFVAQSYSVVSSTSDVLNIDTGKARDDYWFRLVVLILQHPYLSLEAVAPRPDSA